MPPLNRSIGRNVFIYDANSPDKVLGGLILTQGVTNANFYQMVDILFIYTAPIRLCHDSNTVIKRDGTPLRPGKYFIVTSGGISVNDEQWLPRIISQSSGTRTEAFRDAVRLRDGCCIMTEEEPIDAEAGLWSNLEAAHVFPMAHKGTWLRDDLQRWITNSSAYEDPMNSVQNGLLLEAGVHRLFDNYFISINPDDDFKVVSFQRDVKRIAGKYVDRRFVNRPDGPSESLLRWHFRQSVLGNMRGLGEAVFENDFPPGSDVMSEILNGPLAAKRMEIELFDRLAGFQDGQAYISG